MRLISFKPINGWPLDQSTGIELQMQCTDEGLTRTIGYTVRVFW
jgi:hypothetical protein